MGVKAAVEPTCMHQYNIYRVDVSSTYFGPHENFLKIDKLRPFTAQAAIGPASSMSVDVAANDGRGYAQP